ncbi:CBS domain containing-hemolysin-like protein [Virgibacillus litoralis]|uniref:CBS domain containing-hemolysin-like protein n=1 Tax=Virgibacillus litoralis TaxID=578221 RepID=A0ABS4HEF2_9BACI|nr:CBS domain containing-hemolysin-like protein [Virgibacillus litoralis]
MSFIILLVSLIMLSAFFSSSETAYSSVNEIRLTKFVNEGRRGSKRALELVKSSNFDQTLSTILVGNNMVNIAAASISAKLSNEIIGGNIGVVVSTVVMTILILIFGEILPKSLAKEHAESYSLAISHVLYILIKLLTPINYFFLKFKVFFVSRFISKKNNLPSVTEDEIRIILGISEEEGVIDKAESELIHRSMDLDETFVREILTPRLDMVAIDSNMTIEEIKNVFFEERFSRIPVYEENIDNIIGFITEKEFLTHLLKYKEVNIYHLLRKPLFVAESMKISTLLPQLQKNKMPLAIVLNEFGGTAGIVTIEDILEEIVGEILDENEDQLNLVSQINKKVYICDAQYHLRDFAEMLQVSLPKSSYFTLGGWVMENLEAIPSEGDSFTYQNLKISVKEVVGRRLRKVHVEIQRDEGDNINK